MLKKRPAGGGKENWQARAGAAQNRYFDRLCAQRKSGWCVERPAFGVFSFTVRQKIGMKAGSTKKMLRAFKRCAAPTLLSSMRK